MQIEILNIIRQFAINEKNFLKNEINAGQGVILNLINDANKSTRMIFRIYELLIRSGLHKYNP